MLEIGIDAGPFTVRQIWFADRVAESMDYDCVHYVACPAPLRLPGFYEQHSSTLTIDLGQGLETIWNNMDRKSCRHDITRAVQEGIKTQMNVGHDEFFEMWSEFARLRGVGSNYLSVSMMRKYGLLLTAVYNGEILAGNFYLTDGHVIRAHTIASNRLASDKAKARLTSLASRLLIWQAIKYAKESKMLEFDFGGYYTGGDRRDPRYGINFFKNSFGGKLSHQYEYKKYNSILYRMAELGYKGLYSKLFAHVSPIPWTRT